MTEHRDFKRLVRERVARTGESYSIARRRLLDVRDPREEGARGPSTEEVRSLEREHARAIQAEDFEAAARARAAIDRLRPGADATPPLSAAEREAVEPLLDAAADEARRWGHGVLESEHLLLAALVERSQAARVLAGLGVGRVELARELERIVVRGAPSSRTVEAVSPDAVRVLRRALERAERQGRAAPTTADVLFGVLEDGASLAAQFLRTMGDERELRAGLDASA